MHACSGNIPIGLGKCQPCVTAFTQNATDECVLKVCDVKKIVAGS